MRCYPGPRSATAQRAGALSIRFQARETKRGWETSWGPLRVLAHAPITWDNLLPNSEWLPRPLSPRIALPGGGVVGRSPDPAPQLRLHRAPPPDVSPEGRGPGGGPQFSVSPPSSEAQRSAASALAPEDAGRPGCCRAWWCRWPRSSACASAAARKVRTGSPLRRPLAVWVPRPDSPPPPRRDPAVCRGNPAWLALWREGRPSLALSNLSPSSKAVVEVEEAEIAWRGEWGGELKDCLPQFTVHPSPRSPQCVAGVFMALVQRMRLLSL